MKKIKDYELFSPRTKAVVKNEDGSIVLVAMLLFSALISVGLLSSRNASYEAVFTGSVRMGKITESVAEAGLISTLARAAQDPDGFIAFLQAQSANPPYVVRMSDISDSFFDLNALGSFSIKVPTGYVNWATMLSEPVDTNRMPGYSLSGFCFKKFRWEAQAQLGPLTGANDGKPCALSSECGTGSVCNSETKRCQSTATAPKLFVQSEKLFSTYAFVGPITCTY